MGRQLTDEQLSELCMFMRVIDLMKMNQPILDKHIEFTQQFEVLCKKVEEIMGFLSEEECNEVLETHKLQLLEIQQKSKKKVRKEKKRESSR